MGLSTRDDGVVAALTDVSVKGPSQSSPLRPSRVRPPPLLLKEKLFLAVLFAVIGVSTILAFVALTAVSNAYHGAAVAPSSGIITGTLTFFGAGVLAYVFGLRHGVDADHIAAIDNTTRKLLQEGQRPLTVGTWFSLGHSTIVFGLALGIVFAANYINSKIGVIQQVGSVLGTAISGGFLYLIGLINLVIVLEVYRIFQGLRRGQLNETELEQQLQNRGFMNRYFGKLFKVVNTPRQIYPIGVLFGLGFDTASEIFLLAIVAVLSVAGAPIYFVLILPVLFMCGMVAVDTADGATMRYAYGWAFDRPVRKIFYNLTVTVISVLIAFVIGTVELLQVISARLSLSGPFWQDVARLDLSTLGFFVVGTFVITWAIATAYYRHKRFDTLLPPRAEASQGPTA